MKTVYASSVFSQPDSINGYYPKYAVDGKFSNISNGGFFHSGSQATDPNAWFSIDFGAQAVISSIVIFLRNDCCGQFFQNVEVRVGNTPITTAPADTPKVSTNALLWKLNGTGVTGAIYNITPVTRVEGRWLTIQNFPPASSLTTLNFEEVRVFGVLRSVAVPDSNLALGRPAFSSSTHTCGSYPPSKAVDGGPKNDFTSMFHSSDTSSPPDSQPWLSVDLGAQAVISRIVIYNRVSCCGQRLTNAQVRVGNTAINSSANTANITNNALVATLAGSSTTGAVITIPFSPSVVGRWVTVQNFNPLGLPLAILELEVYGIYVNTVPQGNLAFAKPAYSSSQNFDGNWPPSKAVDGGTLEGSSSLFHSALNGDPTPWLSIDLGAPALVSRVVLYNRGDCCGERLGNAELRVGNTAIMNTTDSSKVASNTLVYTFVGNGTTGSILSASLTTPVLGRWVTLQNFHPAGLALNILELQVFGFFTTPDADSPSAVTNLAYRQRTFSSSVNTTGGVVLAPSFAVDGDTYTVTRNYVAQAFQSATSGDTTPWLSVDLGYTAIVSQIILYNRIDCCGEQLYNAELRLGTTAVSTAANAANIGQNTLVWKLSGNSYTQSKHVVKLASPLVGRWVTLQNFHPSGLPLNIQELSVYGTLFAGETGYIQYPAPPTTACKAGNIACKKPAYGSSFFGGMWPGYAVDGDTASVSINGLSSLFQANFGDTNSWLSVDLTALANITRIVIYGRVDCCNERLRYGEVRVGSTPIQSAPKDTTYMPENTLVWSFNVSSVTNGMVLTYDLPTPVAGRWITVQSFHPTGEPLHVKELEVYGTFSTLG